MKKILMALVLLTLSPMCFAHDTWTEDDTKRQAAYLALHIVDWGQTLNIARNPSQFYEKNLILGKHPSVGKVNTYFVTSALVHTGIAYALPAEWRKWFQYVTIGVEAGVITRNYSAGIKINF